MNKSRIRIVSINLALLLVISGVGWWGWSALHPKAAAVTSTTTTVAVNDVIASVSASGTVISPGDVGVSPNISAQIKSINVKVGDRISAGSVLATLENTGLQNSLNQAKTSVNQALATLSSIKINFAQAKSAIQIAQQNLSNNSLTYNSNILTAQNALARDQITRDNYFNTWSPYGFTLDYCNKLNLFGVNTTTVNDAFAHCQTIITNENTLTDDKAKIDAAKLAQQVGAQKDQQAIDSAQSAFNLFKAQQGINSDNPSDADFTVAQAAVATAEANVQVAQNNYDATFVKAPVAGTVASISAVVGQNAPTASSSTIGSVSGFIVLTDVSGLEVKAGFSESDAAKLVVGQSASFTFSALPNASANGKLISVDILPTTASGATTYGAYFSVEGNVKGLKPGMTATVSNTTGAAINALAVASQAVTVRGSGAFVNVVTTKNGKDVITPTPVTVGLQGDSLVQILSGVKAGTKVVLRTVSSTSSSNGFPASGVPGGGGIRVGGFGG